MEIIGSHYKGLKWVNKEENKMSWDTAYKEIKSFADIMYAWRIMTEFHVITDIDFETGNG